MYMYICDCCDVSSLSATVTKFEFILNFFKTEIRILDDDEFNIANCWYGEMKHGHLLSMDEA